MSFIEKNIRNFVYSTVRQRQQPLKQIYLENDDGLKNCRIATLSSGQIQTSKMNFNFPLNTE